MTHATFQTPRGRTVTMTYRPDTSDWNTLTACMTQDEYGLADLALEGEALDVGAHIGGVVVGLLADNTELHVTAIEPLPENVALLRENLAQNGLADRATVVHGAVGTGRVHYGYRGSEFVEHHAYIGNLALLQDHGPDHCPADIAHEHADVPVVSLEELGPEFSFCKIDCEGGEWAFLQGPTERIARIHGEAHPTDGHRMADLPGLLAEFDVAWAMPPAGVDPAFGPLGFYAVRA